MCKQDKLINFRDSLGLSKVTMAEKLKVSYSFYDKVEMGDRNPSYGFIDKFKRAFPEADVDTIFFASKLYEKCNSYTNEKNKEGK